jgi:hypothetical protein
VFQAARKREASAARVQLMVEAKQAIRGAATPALVVAELQLHGDVDASVAQLGCAKLERLLSEARARGGLGALREAQAECTRAGGVGTLLAMLRAHRTVR